MSRTTAWRALAAPGGGRRLENQFWEYTNDGLRLVQVRFTLTGSTN